MSHASVGAPPIASPSASCGWRWQAKASFRETRPSPSALCGWNERSGGRMSARFQHASQAFSRPAGERRIVLLGGSPA